jgi:hypothetical protein
MFAFSVRRFGWAGLLAGLCGFAAGGTFQENFATDPAASGWRVSGDSALFKWNPASQRLEATWDSSRPNSYFAHPLGVSLGAEDDFALEFSLRLTDFAAGVNPAKPNPFQLSIGLVNLARAADAGFVRGTGADSPDLVEFSFFPDPGGAWQWGPSITTSLIDSTGTNWALGGFLPQNLSPGDVYRVKMVYTAKDKVLQTTLLRNGEPYASLNNSSLAAPFTGFQVDHFAVCSYSEAGQNPAYAGSILAHGEMDDVILTTPQSAMAELKGGFANGVWRAEFSARVNWTYALQRTTDWAEWTTVATAASDSESSLVLLDANPPAAAAFYRVRGEPR